MLNFSNCETCKHLMPGGYCNKYKIYLYIEYTRTTYYPPISSSTHKSNYIRCIECASSGGYEPIKSISENKKENKNMNTKRNMDIILNADEIKTIIKQHLESEGYSIKDINDIIFEISNNPIAFNDNTTKPIITHCKIRASK